MQTVIPVLLETTSMTFPLVLAAYITISLMKVPDLSLESAFVCGASVGTRVLFMTNHLPLPACAFLVILSSILGGAAVGITSSSLTSYAKFPHLLSSILTMGIFYGLNQCILGTSNISVASKTNLLAQIMPLKRFPELPTLALTFCVLAILAGLFLRTQLGTSLAAYGNNPQFFSHYGISTRFIFISGILLSNGLAGLAGFFDTETQGFVDISMGNLKALSAITAIILGKTVIRSKKTSSLLVPLVGTILYFVIRQTLVKATFFDHKLFTMVESMIVAGLLATKFSRRGENENPHDLGV